MIRFVLRLLAVISNALEAIYSHLLVKNPMRILPPIVFGTIVVMPSGGALGLRAGAGSSQAAGFVQTEATRCRELSPEDPDPPALNNDAYIACAGAVAAAPRNADIQYRFGLSALQIGRLDEARKAFAEAAILGHCGGIYFEGDIAWRVDHDVPTAESLYHRALACGDVRANQDVFTADFFKQSAYPIYLAALYDGDISAINDKEPRFVTASYVAGFYEALSEQFLGQDFNPCWISEYYRGGEELNALNAAEKGDFLDPLSGWAFEGLLPLVYRGLFPGQGSAALNERRRALRQAGHADLIRMIRQSKCGALAPYKLLEGVRRFAKSPKSIWATIQEKLPHVKTLEDLRLLLKGNDGAVTNRRQ